MVVNYIDQLFLGLLFSAGALICYLINQKYTTSNLLDDGAQFINCGQNYVAHLWKISGRVEINDRWLQTSPRKWLSQTPLHPVGPGQKGYHSHHDFTDVRQGMWLYVVIAMSYSPAFLITEEFSYKKSQHKSLGFWLCSFDNTSSQGSKSWVYGFRYWGFWF